MPIKPAVGDLVRLCGSTRTFTTGQFKTSGLGLVVKADRIWLIVRWLSRFDNKTHYRRTEVEVVKRTLSA